MLSTPIQPKIRHPTKGPIYFKMRKSTRIKQGKPQPPSTIPISIDESVSHREEGLGQGNWKIEEATSLKANQK